MDYAQFITSATRISGLSCPKCASLSYRRHGKHLGIQRYCCKNCGKTFKETVNSPMHWIHNKALMPKYINTMLNHLSLRAAAKELAISESTAFRWRHKLLSSLTVKTAASSNTPSGVAQIKLPYSFKGKRNMPIKPFPVSRTVIVTDAYGQTCMNHLHEKNHALQAAKWLSAVIPPQSLLACAPVSSIKKAVRSTGRNVILFNNERKRLLSNTQSAILTIQDWMARFRGVATKYLHQYWNWFCAVQAATAGSFATDCFGQRQLQHYRRILVA